MLVEDYYSLADGDERAFILTIKYGDYEVFEKLLSNCENVNLTDRSDSNWTLMYAVLEESFYMVQKLVEADADVNIRAIEPHIELYVDKFALNISAYGCCRAFSADEYNCNKKIYDYLFPLTSPELKSIAEENFNRRTDIMFD